ncbi:MAG: hypothetical protein H0T68_04020 [Gemmatimonadales bacterium]|nr:hypothetical protein [Gemmatimonadales bacterium]
MSRPALLAAAPFPLTLRNFVPTGLAGELERSVGIQVHFVSPYPQPEFSDGTGGSYPNLPVAAEQGSGGVPAMAGVTLLDRALKSVHLTGFALEYPDGSLQNLELSRRRSPQRIIARTLTGLAPRGSAGRRWLRQLYRLYRPSRADVVSAFDRVRPSLVLVASPGHYWLDHFVLDEARRRGIASACVVLSWDNLYSRGPLCRRPDHLMVWSEEMRRQAVEVHQFPADRISVVGPLQFQFYSRPVTDAELAAMRTQVRLAPGESYLAYVCGARTAQYDVEDVLELVARLRAGPHRDLRVVVRPHPQGSRAAYDTLEAHGILLDRSPDLTDARTRPEALDVAAIRHMASLLRGARFVASSWGTTALLEACIFDTPSVQLRWMDALPRRAPEEVKLVRDFQRYIHMRVFDATGARPYCDDPSELNAVLAELDARREDYAIRRASAVERLTCLPLGGVVHRVCAAIRRIVPTTPMASVEPAAP